MPEFEVVALHDAMMSSTTTGKRSQLAARVCQLSCQPAPRRGWQTHALAWRNRCHGAPSPGFGGQGVGKKHTDKARRHRNLLLGGRCQEAWWKATQESRALTPLPLPAQVGRGWSLCCGGPRNTFEPQLGLGMSSKELRLVVSQAWRAN